jgi:two-component system, cell cycle response regulator
MIAADLAKRPRTLQSVLIVDDAATVHKVIEVRLRSEKLQLYHAYNAKEGLALLRRHRPDLVLLDLDMPDTNGMDVCRQIRADPALVATPVIFLTGTIDVSVKVQAFDLGAIDYVTKPFDSVELRARVRGALRTKQYYDMLAAKAQLDAITGLWNRAFFDARLAEEVSATLRHQRPLALLMVDIDHFKRINDTWGHPFGDLALREVGQALQEALRQEDVLCRYGGEEFAVILRETTVASACEAGERLRERLQGLVLDANGKPVKVTASFGAAASDQFSNQEDLSVAALLNKADGALYEAKRTGRDRICAAAAS